MAEYLKFNNVIYEALLRKLKPAFKQWLETYFDQSKIETDWKLIRERDPGITSFDTQKYLDAEFFEAIKRSNPEALTEQDWKRLRDDPELYGDYQPKEVELFSMERLYTRNPSSILGFHYPNRHLGLA